MKVIGEPRVAKDFLNGRNPEGAARVVIVTPSGMSGVFQAGILHAAEERGATPSQIALSVGLSAGSWNIAAFTAGQAALLRDVYAHHAEVIYTQMLCGDMLGLWYLKRLLRGEEREGVRLREDVIRSAPHPVCVGVSDLDGNLSLHDLRESDDVYDLCHASSSIPVFGGVQLVRGAWCIDSACADPCPLGKALRGAGRDGRPVEVLVITGRPEPSAYRRVEQWFGNPMTLALMATAWYPWPVIVSTLAIDEKMRRALVLCGRERPRSRFHLCALVPEPDETLPYTFDLSFMRVRRVVQVGANGYEAAHRLADGRSGEQ